MGLCHRCGAEYEPDFACCSEPAPGRQAPEPPYPYKPFGPIEPMPPEAERRRVIEGIRATLRGMPDPSTPDPIGVGDMLRVGVERTGPIPIEEDLERERHARIRAQEVRESRRRR